MPHDIICDNYYEKYTSGVTIYSVIYSVLHLVTYWFLMIVYFPRP